jgi:hypothetical protein
MGMLWWKEAAMSNVLADVLLPRVCATATVTPDQGALSPESAAEQSARGHACFF